MKGPYALPYDSFGSGDGRAVVLLHSLALDRHVWDEFAPLLAHDRRVVAVDLRGHGEAPQDDDFDVGDMAGDVARTIEELDLGRVALVGMSMGGCVAQTVATDHPEHVAALGLVDTTAWYGADAPHAWGGRAERALRDGLDSLSGFQLARWFGKEFLTENPETGERLLATFRANDLPSYASACRALGAFDGRARLVDIAVPTVVVVGELDPATGPEHAKALQRGIAGAELHVIEGAKHLTAVERPAEVADLLRALL